MPSGIFGEQMTDLQTNCHVTVLAAGGDHAFAPPDSRFLRGPHTVTHLTRSLILGCSMLALAACGPEEISSPGGGNIDIDITNPPAATPTPSPTPTATPTVTAAAGCPSGISIPTLTDQGTMSGPTGSYRICALPSVVSASGTLPYIQGLLYHLDGQVDVGTDQGAASTNTATTLTIEPGVMLYASGADYLNVNRGNRLNAIGTQAMPIIFTSRDNVLGLNTDNSSGQWGGVILNGRAPVTDCIGVGATPGTVNCERQVEGTVTPPRYGGANPADNSGTLRYVQIRYSGFILANGDELQSLTTGGIGSGTTLEYIQSHNSSDDGVEFFGGNVNARFLALIGAEDDILDTDTGVKANLQYVLGVQRSGVGDAMLEGDTTNGLIENTPRNNTRIANATLIQNSASGAAAIRIRGGMDLAIVNSQIASLAGAPCIRIDDAQTIRAADAALDEVGPPIFTSVVLNCANDFVAGSGGVTLANTQAIFAAGTNNNADFTATLVNGYINGANEAAAVAADPTALSTYFQPLPAGSANYVGAVRDAATDWTQGWTCNSAAVTFGTTNSGACTSLPIYP